MKAKVQFKAVGTCAKCGREIIRPSECTHAVCYHNPEPVIITLEPALIVPESLYKKYERIASLAEVSVEDLINAVLKEAAKEKLLGMLGKKGKRGFLEGMWANVNKEVDKERSR